ncbi:MAG: RNA polymerase subunit sigma-24 [Bryobacterales bacterium]|nr:RNA polymerase subunit sigma-24 [Bryobacterales bacterium]
MVLGRIIDEVFRTDGRRILAGLIRLAGDFDVAEDALQEACFKALSAWQRDGIPVNPGAWLNTVARRQALDRLRQRPGSALPETLSVPPAELLDAPPIEDDRLRLLYTCCHPALPPASQSALALKTLGGLSTREIARAFVEPESTTAQRLVRAKRRIREAAIPYEVPALEQLPQRTMVVLGVLYLIFNEGYASTEAPSYLRPDLAREAIRLARLTVELLPTSAEARGLLALMLLTDARRAARLTADLELVTLDEQDRSLWDHAQIREGQQMLDAALALRSPGPYQTQAAIAALHAAAPTAAATDWPQIAALYRALLTWTPTPVVELNAAVALGFATRMEAALEWIQRIEDAGSLAGYHLLPAAKAGILRRLHRNQEAATAYARALELASSPVEQRYLQKCIDLCLPSPGDPAPTC